ncbi:hypothetical protein V6Z11_D11G362700 [Gossypium hirsutum]
MDQIETGAKFCGEIAKVRNTAFKIEIKEEGPDAKFYHLGPGRADPPRVGSPRGYSPIRRRFGATETGPKRRRFAIVTKPRISQKKNNSFSFFLCTKQQRNPLLGFSYPNPLRRHSSTPALRSRRVRRRSGGFGDRVRICR